MDRRAPSTHSLASALAAVAALALGAGCSVLLKPDRDAIIEDRDGGERDASMDAGVDGGPDADLPLDGGPDACVARQTYEVSCRNGVDDDCDGFSDCGDFDCASSVACCGTGDTMPLPTGTYASNWRSLNGASFSSPRVTFGGQSAYVFRSCVPLAYGARISTVANLSTNTAADYASLVLTPTDDAAPGDPLAAELALRVHGDGSLRLERAGSDLFSLPAGTVMSGAVTLTLEVSPGLDEAGRAVVRARATATQGATHVLADELAFMPASDLLGAEALPACVPDGLYLAVEGSGTAVTVTGVPQVSLLGCENPRQFEADEVLPALPTPSTDLWTAPADWSAGGLGEPALANFADEDVDRIELWVDASEDERADEIFRPVDFTVGGAYLADASWVARETLLSGAVRAGPNAREPSLLVPMDAEGTLAGSQLWVAYADERASDVFHIVLRRAYLAPDTELETREFFELAPPTGCTSVRDPSLVALDATEEPQILLLFTCERDEGLSDTIGATRLEWDASEAEYVVAGTIATDVVPRSEGAYDDRGVFSPEGQARLVMPSESGPVLQVRVWYLARSSRGRIELALAYGELAPADLGLPSLLPFSANPLLAADDPVLGTADCGLGCAIESFAVASTQSLGTRWTSPYFLFLVDRTRFTDMGVVHELIPLRQLRPAER